MLLVYISGNAQGVGVWTTQATGFTPPSSGTTNIAIVDSNIVWVSGTDYFNVNLRQDYSRTIDGGAHWQAGLTPAAFHWSYAMMTASSATSAWAVFFDQTAVPIGLGLVYHTTDGGANWVQQGANLIYSYPGQSFPDIIHFWDDNNGVIVGDPANGEYEIYTTIDGGTNWVPVPAVDIPDPITADEAAWTTHISTFGNNIWFDTNHGRVYHSSDRGFHWTVAETNLFIPIPSEIQVCFYSATSGIARYYDRTLFTSDIVETSDGGVTWSSTFNPGGFFYGFDVRHVPGTDSMLVSTGAVAGFSGSSYSKDGGHNWITIDQEIPHTALNILDSLTMWTGGRSTNSTSGGISKFVIYPTVACSDPTVSAGTSSASDSVVCGSGAGFDSVTFTSTGVYSPVIGKYSGVSWVITKGDISGSLDPLHEPGFVAGLNLTFPAATTDTRIFVNDQSLIEGLNNAWGIYYWTPIVYGNATAVTIPPNFLVDLALDPACTHVGTSVPVLVNDPTLICGDVVSEIYSKQLNVKAFIKDQSTLDVLINSTTGGKALIQITDPAGRLIKSENVLITNGSNHEMINVENLATGTYILKTEINGNRTSNKIVKY